jgi:CheY-like chemotaxis protein
MVGAYLNQLPVTSERGLTLLQSSTFGARMAGPLDGARILIVEDEAVVAMDLEFTLEDAGASIAGPVGTLQEALEAAEMPDIDAAVLDVTLGREQVFPVADRLMERGIPFVFHSGHASPRELITQYPNARLCRKPCVHETIIESLAALVGR